MRKHLFKWMLLLVAFMVPWTTNAQTEVEIGDDAVTTTSNYLPGYNYYDYSISQQIYTAEEIGMAGTITSVAFKNTVAEKTRTYNVYMALTDLDAFASGTSWVAVSENDQVFAGTVTFAVGEWTTIELDTPFEYDGASNLLITCRDMTGSYSSSPHMACLTFPATGQAIRAYRDNNAYDIAAPGVTGTVDNAKNQIILGITPASGNVCSKPTGAAVVPSTDMAAFSWVASETAVSYQWLYTALNEDPEWERAESTDETSVEIRGLAPMTSYVAYVRANCGGDNFSVAARVSFKTACAEYPVSPDSPFVENFNDASFDFSCWTNEHISGPGSSYGSNIWVRNTSTGATYIYEGAGSLKLPDMNATTITYLTTPAFVFDRSAVNGYEVSFWMNRVSSQKTQEGVKVWVNNQPNDTVGGTMLMHICRSFSYGTYTETGAGWYLYTAEIPAEYYDGNVYILLEGISEYGNASYIDDFTVRARPTCITPTQLTFSNVTAHSAVVSWTPGMEGDAMWEVEYSTDGENWVSSDAIETIGYEFRELDANTDYQVRVRTLCDRGESHSEWSLVASFRTNCETIEVSDEAPYVYGFETEDEFSCWLAYSGATRLQNSSYGTVYSYEGSYCLRLYGASVLAVLPDFANVNMLQLDFFTKLYSTSYACAMEIGYMTNPNDDSTFVAIKTLNSTEYTTTYAPIHVGLSAVPEGARIALRQTGNSYSGWYIDSVVVSPMPSCAAPDNIVISDVTTNSAAVAWTPAFATDNSWELQYSTDGENWISSDALSASSYEFRGLTANTAYQVRVRTLCAGDEMSDWSSVSSFRTECDVYTVTIEAPFTCGFEEPLTCWEVLNGQVTVKTSTSNIHSGSAYLDFRGAVGNAIALPEIVDGTSNGLVLKFWTRPENFSSNSCGTLSVGYMTDLEDDSSYVELDSWIYSSFSGYDRKEVSLVDMPEGARIVMKQINNSTNYYWYVDDVEVAAIPSCLPPANFELATAYAESATFAWTNDGATAWQIEVDGEMMDVNPESVETVGDSISNFTYTVANLAADTTHMVRLRNLCDGDFSPWTDMVNFSTLNNETAVTSVRINGMVSADIDEANHTVTVTMLYGSDFTSLNGSFILSSGATAWYGEQQIPNSFSGINLTNPMTLLVKAEDVAYTQEWTIIVVNESCATATGLTVEPARTKAQVSWNIGDVTVNAFEYVLSDTAVDFENWNGVATTLNADGDTTLRSFLLTGLERGTEYHLYLKNACSNWSVAQHVAFTTHDLSECLQVGEGTTANNQMPIAGWYHYSYTQQLYLENEVGRTGEITSIKFNYFSTSTTQRNITVYMGTTDETSLSAGWITPENMTQVVAANEVVFDNSEDNWYTITLDEPFQYEGGNLLVAVHMAQSANETGYSNTTRFYVTSASGMARYYQNDNVAADVTDGVITNNAGTVYANRSNIQFCFVGEACPAVDVVDVENVGTETATLTWAASEGDYVSSYDIILSTVMLEDTVGVMEATYTTEATSFELEGLEPYTQYYAYVRANCYAGGHEEGSSEWIMTDFRTNSLCHVADNLLAMLTERNAVSVTWTNDLESAVEYMLVGSADTMTAEPEVIALQATDELELTDLAYETEYTLYVRHVCGEGNYSPWQMVEFNTLPECPAVENVAVTPYFNAAVVDWTNGQFSPATEWRVIATVIGENESIDVFDQVVNSHPYTITGLTPETQYVLSVAPVCGESEGQFVGTESFTTPAMPADCMTIADGTYNNAYVPVYGYYCDAYQRTQSIYPAEMLADLQGQTIESLHYYVYSGSSANWQNADFKVRMMVVEENAFATAAFVDNTDATLVYTGHLTASVANGMSITLDEPFTYEGGNLLVEFALEAKSGYTQCNFVGDYAASGSVYGYNSSSYASITPSSTSGIQHFLPKVDFCVTPSDCHTVRGLNVANVTVNSADISWMPGSSETEWQMVVSTEELDAEALAEVEPEMVANVNQSLTDLMVDADYYVYVRPVCSVEDELFGNWSVAKFATAPTCSAPVEAIAMAGDNGEVTFTVIAGETGVPASYDYEYWLVGDEENVVSGTASDSVWTLAGFNTNALYAWHVRANCGENDGNSRWTDGNNFYLCDTYVVTVDNAYTEDFSVAARLSCWASQDNGVDDEEDTYSYWTRGTDSEGNYWLYNSNYYGDIYLYSPLIQLPANGSATLSFIEFVSDGSYFANYGGAHMIYVLPENGTDQEAVVIYNPESVVDGTFERTLALDEFMGETFRLVFEYQGNNADRWGVTNLVVEASNVTNVTMADTACDSYDLVRSDNTVVATYTESGVYEETFEDPTLGPLHVTLNLTVNYSERNHEYVTNCGPYTWEVNGRTYNKGGDKYYKGTTEAGCVSYDTLSLTVIDRYTSHEVVSNCGPYTWEVNGRTYNQSGVKTYKDTTEDGCPTYDTLTLTINQGRTSHDYVTNCGAYTWEVNGQTYEQSIEVINDTFTAEGCPVHDTLTLTIAYGRTSHEYVSNCGPYFWEINGKTYNKGGVKTFKSTTEEGCVNYDTLTLDIYTKISNHEYVTNCGPYFWEVAGKTYNKGGDKYYKGVNEEGCPVYDTLTLVIANGRTSHETVTACNAYTWEYAEEGMAYTQSGLYTHNDVTEEGCDIHDTLDLTIVTKWSNNETVVSCGPYTWDVNGRTYNQGGMKTYKGTAEDGCYVYDTLNLTVAATERNHEYVTNCGPYFWEVAGKTYNKGGDKYYKGTTEFGCPIYDTLTLTIGASRATRDTVLSCGPYTWSANGQTYNKSGVKYYKGTSPEGCSLRDTLILTVAEVERNHEYVSSCGAYTWSVNNQTYNKGGNKYYKGTAENGCPIYDTLTLTIVDRWTSNETVVSCGPYTWAANGRTYNQSGTKIFKGTAEDGCMTYDTLNLTVNPVERNHEYVSNCGPYTWAVNNQTYNKGGVKTYKGTDENGCPIYDTLTLTIVTKWTSNETVLSCGPYTWAANGQTYNKSGVKYYKGTAADGCPSYDTLHLTVAQGRTSHEYVENCGAYTWDVNGQTYNKSGRKTYKATTDEGCPIRDTLDLTIVTKWTSHEYVENCGPYTWEVNGKTYNKGGDKYYKSTAEDGCPVYDTLTLVINNCEPTDNGENIALGESDALNAMTIYPNPTTGRLQINAAQVDKVEVLDMVGRRVAVYENTLTLDLSNLAAGTYTLRVTMPEGVALRKVVKR